MKAWLGVLGGCEAEEEEEEEGQREWERERERESLVAPKPIAGLDGLND
jgi:hypothetical protein